MKLAMKTVLVVGRDWRFRALLRAQLREEGFYALGFETLADAQAEIGGSVVLIFDTTEARPAEWQPALQQLAARLPVVVVAGTGEEAAVAGAKVLRRPLSLADIARVVRELTTAAP
jgi:FixJ family two-component response regulator